MGNLRKLFGQRLRSIRLAKLFASVHLTGILHTHYLPIQFPLLTSSYKMYYTYKDIYGKLKKIVWAKIKKYKIS